MTIGNITTFTNNIWDWGILSGCFSATKTAPTDIDGVIEKNGNFLILEAKSPGVSIKTGQQILFDSLHKLGKFTIIVIWGARDSPEEMQVFYPNGRKTEKKKCNLDDLRNMVAKWYAYADIKEE